ncbi:hypothetical protein KXS11_07215 [Plantibacter flavus]|uniref:hypothetical protein n=1 Tax=Plantibacter flavus TaxID=150123 RepID=UPI003F17B5EA
MSARSAEAAAPRGRTGHHGWRRRIVVLLIVLSAVLVFARPAPVQTEAAWTDPEFGAASFTALTVPPVTASGCVVNPGLAGILGSFTMTFQLPAGYALANVSYAVANNAAMTGATVVTPSVAGPTGANYTATFGTGLLGLLGSNVYLGILVSQPSTTPAWTSPYKVAHGVVAALAINSSCTLV